MTAALLKSFQQEYERVETRKSVWMQSHNGWYHSNNTDIVKLKLSSLADTINELTQRLSDDEIDTILLMKEN